VTFESALAQVPAIPPIRRRPTAAPSHSRSNGQKNSRKTLDNSARFRYRTHTPVKEVPSMKNLLVIVFLLAFGAAAHTLAAGASGAGTYRSRTCDCSGIATTAGVVSFEFKFEVAARGGCEPARGTIVLKDTACKVRLKGEIRGVEVFDLATPAAAVHGVVTSGALTGKLFRLKIYPDSFTFHIVSARCASDCPGYFTSHSGLPAGAITFVP
jgi:hypothetical protein